MVDAEARKKWLGGYGLVVLAVIMWSFSEILQKLLQDSVPPMSKSFFRFFIGIIPLFIIMIAQRDLRLRELWHHSWKDLIIAGVFGFGIGNFVYFLGIVQTQANLGSVIYGTYPLFISIYSIFMVGERSNLKRRFIGYAIGFFAIALLMTNGDFSGFLAAENFVGNLLVLAGAAIWSIFSVLGKKITKQHRATISNIDLKFNFITMALAGATNFVLLVFMPAERSVFLQYSATAWIYLILLGVFVTGISTWLFFVGIAHLEVSKGISFAMFKPVFVIIFSFMILREIPTLILLVSLPLIIIAVWIITK
jgi:drug/metabolite transporter (DMT)-like permease